MSLLVDMVANALDEGYRAHDDRFRGATLAATPALASVPVTKRRVPVAGAAALVLLGVVTGTAVAQVRHRAAANVGPRAQLAYQVAERTADGDRLLQEASRLRTSVAASREQSLSTNEAGRIASRELAALELAVATTAVAGPGVRLTLSEAPASPAAPSVRGGSPALGRILDRDLQDVVNGLWSLGAEAVSINGVRLSARTSIRSAGEAVLVDFRPQTPPYRVEVIGASTLAVDFLDAPSGRRLQALASFSGISFSLDRVDRLELAAATEPELRVARPAGAP